MKTGFGILIAAAAAIVCAPPGVAAQTGGRLQVVKARGELRCGVSTGLAGFGMPDRNGTWRGLDVDVCRAVGAAVLGDAAKVVYVPLSAKDRFTVLQTGEVDLLARNASWTLARNTKLGINFVATNFYDGQAFMVRGASKIRSIKELNGASICVLQGTSTEGVLADYFRANGLRYEPVVYEAQDGVAQAYFNGRCDALTSDQSQLTSVRSLAANPADHVILPELISKEPLSPAVRSGDDQWANVVRWSFFAMLDAEELGLDSKNIKDQTATSKDPNVLRFVGKTDDLGSSLGLDNEWAVRIVTQVGNYAESFERNIAPLGLERGVNRLWKDGGILIAPPIR